MSNSGAFYSSLSAHNTPPTVHLFFPSDCSLPSLSVPLSLFFYAARLYEMELEESDFLVFRPLEQKMTHKTICRSVERLFQKVRTVFICLRACPRQRNWYKFNQSENCTSPTRIAAEFYFLENFRSGWRLNFRIKEWFCTEGISRKKLNKSRVV